MSFSETLKKLGENITKTLSSTQNYSPYTPTKTTTPVNYSPYTPTSVIPETKTSTPAISPTIQKAQEIIQKKTPMTFPEIAPGTISQIAQSQIPLGKTSVIKNPFTIPTPTLPQTPNQALFNTLTPKVEPQNVMPSIGQTKTTTPSVWASVEGTQKPYTPIDEAIRQAVFKSPFAFPAKVLNEYLTKGILPWNTWKNEQKKEDTAITEVVNTLKGNLVNQGKNDMVAEGKAIQDIMSKTFRAIIKKKDGTYTQGPYMSWETGMKIMGPGDILKNFAEIANKSESANTFSETLSKNTGFTAKELDTGFKGFGLGGTNSFWQMVTGNSTDIVAQNINNIVSKGTVPNIFENAPIEIPSSAVSNIPVNAKPIVGTQKETQQLLSAAKQYLPNFDEKLAITNAQKIAILEKSNEVLPQHIAEAIQYQSQHLNTNSVNVNKIFSDNKGNIKDFSGNEIYDRLKQIGITDNLNPDLPQLFKKVNDGAKSLNPDNQEILRMYIKNTGLVGTDNRISIDGLKQIDGLLNKAQKISKERNYNLKEQRYSLIEAMQPSKKSTVIPASKLTPEQSLTQEAKKYKSAEEFVRAQKGESVYTLNEKELGLKTPEDYKNLALSSKNESDFISKMRGNKAGSSLAEITGIKSSGEGWFTDASNFYKSQLTDFWNKANKESLIPKPKNRELFVNKTNLPEISKTESIKQETMITHPKIDGFIRGDVISTAKGISGGISKTWDIIKKTLTPTNRGEVAKKAGSILRSELGKMAREKEITYQSLLKARKIFDTYTPEQSLDFINKLEKGEKIDGSEQFSTTIRDALGKRWGKIQKIKGTSAYIENYFPHIWKDPEKATQVLQGFGKRPFEGTKGYMKERKIPTIKEGIALGLEPASYNPIDLVMARISDMDRFLMADSVWKQYKETGIRKFIRLGQKPPEGWKIIDDKISRSFQFSPEEKGMILRGNWYMPEQVATIVNNYLSPGLSANPIYNAFRMLGNNLNQIQLGISAYHALFTSIDAVTSKTALEIQKVFNKSVPISDKVVSLGKAILSPVVGPYYLFENIVRGNKLLKDYFKQNPQIPRLVDALEKSGGRVRMDSFYLNSAVENFLKALRTKNYMGALFRSPGALLETISKPLLQVLVPRQKLGIFSDGASFILKQAEKGDWSEYKTTLRLQELWDSVDNRMGQLVYDNLFWNKTLKDIGMASVRSVGWNLGDIREIPGGIIELLKTPTKVFTKKGRENIRMTPKMAYVIALPYVVGILGAIIYYLYNKKAPKTLLDIYYPTTGKEKPDGTPERISIPSYMKDVFAYGTRPGQTIANKLHPEISTIIDMLQNQDFYGTEIRNPNDPLVKQVGELFAYQAKQFVPFSVTNSIQRKKTGEDNLSSYLQSFVGITPAPSYITRTSLQTQIYDLYDKRFGGGVQSKEQRDIQQQKTEIRTLYLSGKTDEANVKLKEAVSNGIIKENGVQQFIDEADIPSDIKLFQQLSSEDQLNLIKKMQPYELSRYAWYSHLDIRSKLSSISENTKAWVDLYNSGEITKPVWKKGQEVGNITQSQTQSSTSTKNTSSFIDDIVLYAKSIGTDPITAFNRIFTGQRITKLVNGTIIVERMPFSESSKIKNQMGGNIDYQLDHIIPLELGGSNDKSNLVLIPVTEAEKLDKLENELGAKLVNKTITKTQAQAQIKEAKKAYIK